MSGGVALQLALDSLAAGGVYALVALGVHLAFAGSGVLHLAVGDTAMAGAVVGGFISAHGASAPLSALVGIAYGAALGAVLAVAIVEPTRGRVALAAALLALGGTALRQAIVAVLQQPVYPFPSLRTEWTVGSGHLRASDLLTIGVVAALAVVAALVLRRTRAGAALRVTAATPDAAELCGVDTGRVRLVAFAVAGGLAALGALLAAGRVAPSMGGAVALTLKGVAGAVVGGVRSPGGACLGALAIGTVEVLGGYWWGGGAGEAMAYGAGVLALAVRGLR